ncbi:MAG: methylmalonyl Co-A mutase-associated GTPase MeaB [Bacteroidales bacterium]
MDTPKSSALHVQEGIEQPSRINPYLNKKKIKRTTLLSKQAYIDGILSQNIIVLSQAITLIESNLREHHELGQEIIEACIPYASNSVRIGITGVPGAGKSTFIDVFGKHITSLNHKLAVLTIDPSSERSKGSILGDKTRMDELSLDKNAFIRPSPSAGSLGGVARKTRETIILCEAAGFDTIIVETVGVGQSETAVHSMVDFFLLLMISGAGDELQGIKRGIMEMADTIVVNKADGDNLKKAELTKVQLSNALKLFPLSPSQWRPCVLTSSALHNQNIDEIWNVINEYVAHAKANGYFVQNRLKQSEKRFYHFLEEELFTLFYSDEGVKAQLPHIEKLLLDNKISAYAAGKKLLDLYIKNTCDKLQK